MIAIIADSLQLGQERRKRVGHLLVFLHREHLRGRERGCHGTAANAILRNYDHDRAALNHALAEVLELRNDCIECVGVGLAGTGLPSFQRPIGLVLACSAAIYRFT
ncbi:MAG: hypothetical protein U0638_16390 [Phycisphaerales bacterium]